MNCLWCNEANQTEIDWSNFIYPRTTTTTLCDSCSDNLQFLKGNRCRKCSRETKLYICYDCKWWEQGSAGDPLDSNFSVFHYNDFMQEMIARWKYRGDYILVDAFKPYVEKEFMKIYKRVLREALITPIPLSNERLKERAFNQAEALANIMPGKKIQLLNRKHAEKQSKLTREERIQAENPFTLHQTINKPVILVDDIYTTGTTLRRAAQVLKESGCPAVYSFTLIRG
ncbi:ComF family protein [Oceanobacillus sp. CAU 1775]